MSEKNLLTETANPANLTRAQRGHLAELIFMRRAASLGFSVAKPWAEGQPHDVIVSLPNACFRVQVKSVLAKSPSRNHFRVRTTAGRLCERHYSVAEVDFLAAYIFQEDLWYIFPVAVLQNRKGICLSPASKRCRYEEYREAWNLMRPRALPPPEMGTGAEIAVAQT